METGHPSTWAVNSGSGNRALLKEPNYGNYVTDGANEQREKHYTSPHTDILYVKLCVVIEDVHCTPKFFGSHQ